MSRFLRNAWYAAAWGDELDDGRLLARRLLDQPVVLYRGAEGPVALLDRCPHRFAPLSLGKRVGDVLECPYHGLRFGADGNCVLNPHGDGKVPRQATVASFPVVERHALVWIWMGDRALADPAAIPEFGFHTDPSFHNVKGYTLAKGHYELMTDNIMDLSHVEFLHGGLLGSEAIKRAKVEVLQDGNTVHSNRLTSNEDLPPFMRKWYQCGDGPVQRWLNVRWQAPANMQLVVGVLPEGAPREQAHESPQAHLMTPETATTTHYFWSQGRDWGGPSAEMDQARLNALRIAFDEQDKPMIEAVQRNMGDADFDALNPVLLPVDGGPVRARRVLKQLLAKEQAAQPQQAASSPA